MPHATSDANASTSQQTPTTPNSTAVSSASVSPNEALQLLTAQRDRLGQRQRPASPINLQTGMRGRQPERSAVPNSNGVEGHPQVDRTGSPVRLSLASTATNGQAHTNGVRSRPTSLQRGAGGPTTTPATRSRSPPVNGHRSPGPGSPRQNGQNGH